jgi:hypothetical protein
MGLRCEFSTLYRDNSRSQTHLISDKFKVIEELQASINFPTSGTTLSFERLERHTANITSESYETISEVGSLSYKVFLRLCKGIQLFWQIL